MVLALKKFLQSVKIDNHSLRKAYEALGHIVKAMPQLAKQVLATVKIALQSDKNDCYSLSYAYYALGDIVKAKPALTEQVFATVKTALLSDKNDCYSLSSAYHALGHIVKAQPELAEQAFATFNTALQSDKNDWYSLVRAYIALRDIVEAKPELAERVFATFNTAFQLPSRSKVWDSLESAYETLGDIVKAKPELAEQVLATVKISLQLYKNYCNNSDSLEPAYETLGDIVKAKPELAEQVLTVTAASNIEIDIYLKNNLYKACMKHLPLEETVAKHPEMEQDLRIAHKGRFASDDEFKYALEHFDEKDLAESMIFRAQQRVMNVLVSTSAQEYGMEKAVAESFRKHDAPQEIKDYMSSNNDWLIPASFKGAAIFKDYFPSYIKTIQNHNQKNPENQLSTHDAVYWLPEPMSKEANERFSQFIQRNIIYQTVDENGQHKMVHRPLEELKIIAQNWKALEKKLENRGENAEITKLKYNDVLSICMSVKYADQRNDVFAVEAAKHGVPESKYHNCEDIYLAGLKVPEPFDSKKEFKEGKYIGRFLPREDPITIFFGDYTDCCQHYGGVGHSCAVSTVKHPFSQLFVIEDDKGKIIAGSWTWENTEGKYREVCFDNIESLGELSSRPELNKIYEQVGEYLTKEQNCHKVTIGLGYQDADVSGYAATETVPLPKLYGNDGTNSYSDARSQVLLAENPKAEPLDKTQESQRYVRDVCFLDMEAMDRVSEAVFPDGDKQLQAPDNMAGFVIEDREKGVVGYCLYDKEEKSIYDMAVLPEYRTDKNASSRKLFAEMMRTINKEGGEWSAEMRDKTSLRFLKTMAERGLVKYEEHGVDHTMSDGSEVIAVTFTPVRDDVRQAINRLKNHVNAEKETSTPVLAQTTANRKTGRNPMVYE